MEYTLANKTIEAYKIAHQCEKRFFQGEVELLECLQQLLTTAIDVTESTAGFWHFKTPHHDQKWLGFPEKDWDEMTIRTWQEVIKSAYSESSPTLLHYPAGLIAGLPQEDIPMVHWPIVIEGETEAILILIRDKAPYLPEALTHLEPLTRAGWQLLREVSPQMNSKNLLGNEDLVTWSSYLEHTDDAYFVVNDHGLILDCSQGSKGLLGLLKTQAIQKNLFKFIYTEDHSGFKAHLKEVITQPKLVVSRVMTRDGATKVVEWKISNHTDSSLRYLMARDITKEYHNKQVLQKSKSYAEQLIEGLPDGVALFNPGGVHLDVNPAFLEMTGFSPDELKGQTPPFPYWPEEETENIQAAFDKTLKGNFEEVELVFQRKSGERFPVVIRSAHITDSQGHPVTIYATVKDITQQKLVLEQVKENEYRFRQLVMNSPLAIIIHSEGIIRFCNPAAVHLLEGIHFGNFLGKPILSFLQEPENDPENRLSSLTPTKTSHTTEEKIISIKGNALEVEVTSHHVTFEGKPAHQAIFRDITERKKALDALKASEEKHRFLVESVPHVIWTAREPGQVEMCNTSGLNFLGTTTQNILSQGWLPFVHAEDRMKVTTIWERAIQTGEAYRLRYRLGNPDTDNYRWMQEEAVPMKKEDATIVRWYGVATDMHEQILAENALSKREAFLNSLVQSQTTFLVRLNNHGRFQFVNEAFRTRFQHQGPLLGKVAQAMVLAEDVAALENTLKQCLAEPGVPFSVQLRLPQSEGEVLWIAWEFVGLRNAHGAVLEVQGVGNDITKLKEAENSIQEERKKLVNVTNSVPGVVYQLRRKPNGTYAYDFISEAVYDIYQIPKNTKITIGDLFQGLSDDPHQQLEKLLKNSAENLTPWKYEFQVRLPSGEYRWLLNKAVPEPILGDGSVRWNGILTDITEQKSLKSLLDDTSRIAKVGGWEISLPSQELIWTEETYRIHELPVGTPIDVDSAIGYYTPRSQPMMEDAVNGVLAEGGTFDVTAQLTTAKGSTLWVRSQGRAIVSDGKVTRLMGTIQDVTISQEIELRLRESEAILRTSLEHSLVSNVLLSKESNILYIDQRTKNLISYYTGTPPEVGDWFPQFLPRQEIEKFEQKFALAYKGETVNVERQITYPQQKPFWLELVYRPVMQESSGSASAVVFSFQDITGRKTAEMEVKKMAMVAENTDNLIIITDGTGYIEWANDPFFLRSGYSFEEVSGHQPGLFLFGAHSDKQVIRTIEEAFVLKQKVKSELMQYTKHGIPYWVELDMEPIWDQDGNVIHFILLENDITERKAAEKEIQEQNKELKKTNQELDTFVYRVSHDLRAPLVSSLGLIDLTLNESDPAIINKYLGLQKKSLSKLDNFIKDILNYSRNSRLEIVQEPINFQELVGGIFEQLNYIESYKSIERVVKISNSGEFFSDQRRLHVVLSNLISNALKFSRHHLPDAFVKVEVSGDHEWVEIRVDDNGQGIPEEHLANIFKMFYRATDRQSGSGLGLYIVKETIEKLGGAVEVESTINEGTLFKMLLPNLKAEK
ncbi:MAG: PAS domain S-box protein [Bacteroidota bacterium]